MLADGSHGRVGSGADVVVHQLPDPLTQVILYVQLPDQLSNHVVLESTKKRKRRRRKKVDLSVSANFAGGTVCCPLVKEVIDLYYSWRLRLGDMLRFGFRGQNLADFVEFAFRWLGGNRDFSLDDLVLLNRLDAKDQIRNVEATKG